MPLFFPAIVAPLPAQGELQPRILGELQKAGYTATRTEGKRILLAHPQLPEGLTLTFNEEDSATGKRTSAILELTLELPEPLARAERRLGPTVQAELPKPGVSLLCAHQFSAHPADSGRSRLLIRLTTTWAFAKIEGWVASDADRLRRAVTALRKALVPAPPESLAPLSESKRRVWERETNQKTLLAELERTGWRFFDQVPALGQDNLLMARSDGWRYQLSLGVSSAALSLKAYFDYPQSAIQPAVAQLKAQFPDIEPVLLSQDSSYRAWLMLFLPLRYSEGLGPLPSRIERLQAAGQWLLAKLPEKLSPTPFGALLAGTALTLAPSPQKEPLAQTLDATGLPYTASPSGISYLLTLGAQTVMVSRQEAQTSGLRTHAIYTNVWTGSAPPSGELLRKYLTQEKKLGGFYVYQGTNGAWAIRFGVHFDPESSEPAKALRSLIQFVQQVGEESAAPAPAAVPQATYSEKEQKLLAKLAPNPFQNSVLESVKKAGWRIDNAYGFTFEKEPPGVYVALSRSEGPVPAAALPPLSLNIFASAVGVNAVGFLPAKDDTERVRFQEQLQKRYSDFKVTVLSSSALTPGYDRVVLSLPERMPAAAVATKLLATLQQLQSSLASISETTPKPPAR